MLNPDTPPRLSKAPTTKQHLWSMGIAVAFASAILITLVLPAEFGFDPTGVGTRLGLTPMGEVKMQLAKEAAADAAPSIASSAGMAPRAMLSLPPATVDGWEHEMRVALEPGQGAAVKLKMKAGEQAEFSWTSEGGAVHFDTRGHGGGRSVSYEKGRNVPADDGVLEAAFDGHHGWFWRNRGASEVTVVVRARGDYEEMKRIL